MKKFIKNIFSTILIIFCFTQFSYAASPYTIVEDPSGVFVVHINTSKHRHKIQPAIVSSLTTNKDVYNKLKPLLLVNAGFFDPKNQKTVSYVRMNGQIILDPKNNENLMDNEALKPYMDKILNRSEFRILEDEKGHFIYDIAAHNDEVQEGYTLQHSVQAGPMLVPDLRLKEEFFILERDGKIISESASSLHKYARTVIGIKDNDVYLFIITDKNPMTLQEAAELAQKWGVSKAMAFDGGGSTSFDSQELHIISQGDNQGRKLKSFLMFK